MTSFWLDTHPIPDRSTALAGGEAYDTVVVGAGLTGLTTALLLARAGQRVGILEARAVGAVTTGHTTAKLSLLQGTMLSRVRSRQGDEVLRAYVEGNRAAQAWLVQFLAAAGIAVERREAVTYANADPGLRSLDAEREAAEAAGLAVTWAQDTGLPFGTAGAIRLAEQVQIHPTRALDALLAEFVSLGGVLHTGVRVRDVDVDAGCRVVTPAGSVSAERVVLATGTPILDRGGHFARLVPQRSYALAFRVPGVLPTAMYLSVDAPSRSLRTAAGPEGEVLLVGGNSHPVGRHESPPRALVDDLIAWTGTYFPGAERTHVWSAQDYSPSAGMPLVGALPWSDGRVFVATGYAKWGMTNAVAAALRLAGVLTGERPGWAGVLDAAHGAGLGTAAKANAEVAGAMASGWLAAESHGLPADPPAEGEGVVGRLNGLPAARSTVAGRTCTVSAVCTHLGGILSWNDVERSWDCPLHGSRFDSSGRVLEGPAVSDLAVHGQEVVA